MFKIPGLDTYFGSEKSQGCNSVPNIIGFRLADGVFVGVEVKAGRDTLRDDQKQFLNELKQAGGVAFVAYNFAQFQHSFEGRGLLMMTSGCAQS